MCTCIPIPRLRPGAAAYQPGRRSLGLAALLVTLGCASVETGTQETARGSSGGVTWEVSDIGRIVSSDNQRIRWSYLILLRNTSDRVIQLEHAERAIGSDSGEVIGGTPTSQPFRRTLGARSDLRIPMSDSWGWITNQANRAFGGASTLSAITAFRRFSGTDDRGAPIEIRVRVRLGPSVGLLAKPPTRPQSLPAPTTLESAGDLVRLVGLWRGSYRQDGSILDVPTEVTILADGTFQVAENEPVTNRFSRTVRVKDGGLDYSGGRDLGTVTLHESAGKRMLVGRVSQVDGQPYAIYLEAQAPAGAASEPSVPPASTLVSAPSSSGMSLTIDLTGSYRGTVTGTRDGRSYFDRVTVAVIQSGREFSGTWTTPSASGTLAGTVLARTNFTFRLRQETPCVAEFGGLGAIDEAGSRLAASYRGGGCQGSNVAASLVVTREAR